MADKVTLASIASFQNDTTAAAAYNSNNALITTAMDNTLSRDGTSPNQMGANLDMNNNQILNLPSPATVNSPARLVDVASNPTITVPPTGTSGAVVGLLNANKTDSGNNTFSGTETFNGNCTFNGTLSNSNATSPIFTNTTTTGDVNSLTLTNTNAGNRNIVTVVNPSSSNNSGSRLLLNTGLSNCFLISEINTGPGTQFAALTAGSGMTGNFEIQTSSSSAPILLQPNLVTVLNASTSGVAITGTLSASGGLVGVTTNSSASAGNVGEYVESVIPSGSAVSITSATNTNLTSISLTAGDWDLDGGITFVGSATTVTWASGYGSFSTTSLTQDFTAGRTSMLPGATGTMTTGNGFINISAPLSMGSRRFSLGSTTTIYLVANTTFAGTGTMSMYGILRARRVR